MFVISVELIGASSKLANQKLSGFLNDPPFNKCFNSIKQNDDENNQNICEKINI